MRRGAKKSGEPETSRLAALRSVIAERYSIFSVLLLLSRRAFSLAL